MTRIFLIIISIMLHACSASDTRIKEKVVVSDDVSIDNSNKQDIVYEVVFEKGNDLQIKRKSSFFDNVKSRFFSEYKLSPDDELDVFLTTKVWENNADYDVMIGDRLLIKFKYASQYDVSPKVEPNGNIALPFIGKYNVSGKSTLKIQQDISALYGKIFRKPQLKVMLPDYLTRIRELRNEMRSAKRGLRRLVTVRTDGYTVFPLVGEYKVAGKTLNEVSKELNEEYSKINPLLQADLFLK